MPKFINFLLHHQALPICKFLLHQLSAAQYNTRFKFAIQIATGSHHITFNRRIRFMLEAIPFISQPLNYKMVPVTTWHFFMSQVFAFMLSATKDFNRKKITPHTMTHTKKKRIPSFSIRTITRVANHIFLCRTIRFIYRYRIYQDFAMNKGVDGMFRLKKGLPFQIRIIQLKTYHTFTLNWKGVPLLQLQFSVTYLKLVVMWRWFDFFKQNIWNELNIASHN